MKNVQAIFILILLVIFSIPGTTQSLSTLTTGKIEKPKREVEFSLFMGRSFLGPVDDFKEALSAQTNTTVPMDPNNVSQEAYINTSPSYFFEFKYNFNEQSGISISRGTMDAFSFDQNGISPRVHGGLKSTSLNYEHSLGQNRHEFSTGISFMSLQMKSTGNNDRVSGNDKVKKVGVNLGYAYHIIESNGFFLAVHAQYNWAGTAEVGPYSIHEPARTIFVIIGNISIPSRDTQYPAVKVNLDSFNIGFTAGFRFGDMASPQDDSK